MTLDDALVVLAMDADTPAIRTAQQRARVIQGRLDYLARRLAKVERTPATGTAGLTRFERRVRERAGRQQQADAAEQRALTAELEQLQARFQAYIARAVVVAQEREGEIV